MKPRMKIPPLVHSNDNQPKNQTDLKHDMVNYQCRLIFVLKNVKISEICFEKEEKCLQCQFIVKTVKFKSKA